MSARLDEVKFFFYPADALFEVVLGDVCWRLLKGVTIVLDVLDTVRVHADGCGLRYFGSIDIASVAGCNDFVDGDLRMHFGHAKSSPHLLHCQPHPVASASRRQQNPTCAHHNSRCPYQFNGLIPSLLCVSCIHCSIMPCQYPFWWGPQSPQRRYFLTLSVLPVTTHFPTSLHFPAQGIVGKSLRKAQGHRTNPVAPRFLRHRLSLTQGNGWLIAAPHSSCACHFYEMTLHLRHKPAHDLPVVELFQALRDVVEADGGNNRGELAGGEVVIHARDVLFRSSV